MTVFIAGVKRQKQLFLIGILRIISIEFLQIIHGCIRHRRFPRLLKTESPVAVCRRIETLFLQHARRCKDPCSQHYRSSQHSCRP